MELLAMAKCRSLSRMNGVSLPEGDFGPEFDQFPSCA